MATLQIDLSNNLSHGPIRATPHGVPNQRLKNSALNTWGETVVFDMMLTQRRLTRLLTNCVHGTNIILTPVTEWDRDFLGVRMMKGSFTNVKHVQI